MTCLKHVALSILGRKISNDQESHLACQKFDFPGLTTQHMKQNLEWDA